MHVLELDVDVDHSFYCPVTGQLILAPEEYKPSPATAFVLPPEAEDFDAMQPGLRKIWDKVKAASDDEDPQPWQLFEDFCKELEHRPREPAGAERAAAAVGGVGRILPARRGAHSAGLQKAARASMSLCSAAGSRGSTSVTAAGRQGRLQAEAALA
jgi:hypothetical protein